MPWKQSEESRTWQKERVIQELRSQGKRMTKQRMVLLDVILSGKWNCCKENIGGFVLQGRNGKTYTGRLQDNSHV